jgi:tRNA 2-thiouridine synthesizing protein D
MKFGLLVSEGPYTHQASDSAYQFVVAALAKGHEIQRVFFYHDGVNNAAEHKVDLVVCVAAALRRGIKEEVLAPGFRISGLGQLVDSGIKTDRLVTFGD